VETKKCLQPKGETKKVLRDAALPALARVPLTTSRTQPFADLTRRGAKMVSKTLRRVTHLGRPDGRKRGSLSPRSRPRLTSLAPGLTVSALRAEPPFNRRGGR